MKKFKLLSAIAMVGLLGLSTHAAINNYDLLNVKLTALVQTNTAITDGSKFKAIKTKIVNKDILKLIANEYTNLPAITNKGAQLAVDDFFGGEFEVVSNGTILLANAGESPQGVDDAYEISITTGNEVDTGSETETSAEFKDSEKDFVVTSLNYEDGLGHNIVEVDGAATVNEKETEISASDKFTESFKFSGTGNATINGDSEAGIVTGTVTGSGKFND